MTSAAKAKQIDSLMEDASQALAHTDYFRAERTADEALTLARQAKDFGRMARIIMPLQEARRLRLQQALDVGAVTVVHEPIDEEMNIQPGCYVVQPPRVGVEARRFRLLALQRDIPVAVVCREPLTRLGLCPVVALSAGATVRTQIKAPDDPEHPDPTWFVSALEELGDFAIESLDPALTTLKRLDALMNRLDAIPEHERLHQALEETCRQAQIEKAEHDRARAASGRRSKGRAESEDEP